MDDEEIHALSNVSLRWMVREIVKASITLKPNEALRKPKFEIHFEPTALEQWNIPQREIWPSTARELSEATIVEGTLPPQVEGIYEQHRSSLENKVCAHGDQACSCEDERERAEEASEEEKFFDTNDALRNITDELKTGNHRWFYRFLEILPTYYERQDVHGRWVGQWK